MPDPQNSRTLNDTWQKGREIKDGVKDAHRPPKGCVCRRKLASASCERKAGRELSLPDLGRKS